MIKLLVPLGLLGLLSILALILIHILKPNYQQKMISSTYVWKLSLKYKKKKPPISRFRNLLLIICQILILASCAFILSQPVLANGDSAELPEKVLIIDASASMRSEHEGISRFERAVEKVKAVALETVEDGGYVTVILADDDAHVLSNKEGLTEFDSSDFISFERVTGPVDGATYRALEAALDDLIENNTGDIRCSYGTGDIDDAITIAEDVLVDYPKTEVVLYTGTKYYEHENVTVEDVKADGEFNVAILNATPIVKENYYTFSIDLGCYADKEKVSDKRVSVELKIYGANYEKIEQTFVIPDLTLRVGEEITVEIDTREKDYAYDESAWVSVYSFESAIITLHAPEGDGLSYDNTFSIYDGDKPEFRIQYSSPNPHFSITAAMLTLQDVLKDRWFIEVNEVKKGEEPAIEGYDMYIFETNVPSTLPIDGMVMLVNPLSIPGGIGVTRVGEVSGEFTFAPGDPHPITDSIFINADTIAATKYTRMSIVDEEFKTLMSCGGDPAVMVKNTALEKIAIFSFSFAYSTFSVLPDFSLMMYNMLNFYFPVTFTEFVYDVGESINVNARGTDVKYSAPGEPAKSVATLPASIPLYRPGTHAISQTTLGDGEITEYFYVKLPSRESNVCLEEDTLKAPFKYDGGESLDLSLLIYIAAALVALLFIEWWLHLRSQA